jgi:hypothetical protein
LLAFAGVLALSGGAALGQAPGVSGQIELTSELTAKQKLEFSQNALSEMDEAVARVQKLLKTAEGTGEPEQIECVSVKLRAIKALREVASRSQGRMNEALAAGQDFKADTELRQISVALGKVRQFQAEAEACVGEAGTSQGDTIRDYDGPAEVGPDDTEGTYSEGEIGVDPPNTTPFE